VDINGIVDISPEVFGKSFLRSAVHPIPMYGTDKMLWNGSEKNVQVRS
jgi:hypothetical protein